MDFLVLRSGQVIADEAPLPGAVPARVTARAVPDPDNPERNVMDGWVISVNSLEDLLRLVDATQGQVVVRRPMDFSIEGQDMYALDVTAGIGH